MRKHTQLIVAFCAVTAFPGVAQAQEWLRDRRNTEGAGILFGDLEFHPGIGIEGGYDTNYYMRSSKSGPNVANGPPLAPVLGAGILRVTPSMSLATLGEQRREGAAPPSFKFRWDLAASYSEYFGDDTIKTNRNVSGNTTLRADINQGKPFSVGFMGTYTRTIQPNVNADPNLSFNRSDVGGGIDFTIAPDSGMLDWRFGYQLRASLFEQTGTGAYTSLTHEVSTKGRWRFGPKTALVHETNWRYLSYPLASDTKGTLREAMPLRTRVGISGLITHRFAATALVGYGGSFFDNSKNPLGKQYDSVIANADLSYYLTPTPGQDDPMKLTLQQSAIGAGYERDFQASLLGDYFGLDRVYLKFSYLFAGRVLLSANTGFSIMKYPQLFYNDGQVKNSPFTDYRIDATVFGEYRFTDSFAIALTGKYLNNISKAKIPVEVDPTYYVDMNFQRIEGYLALRYFK